MYMDQLDKEREDQLIAIGSRLREVREDDGSTQEAFGRKLAISRQTLSKYENGSAVPDIMMLAEYCKKFDVSADTILFGTERKRSADLTEFKRKLQNFINTH